MVKDIVSKYEHQITHMLEDKLGKDNSKENELRDILIVELDNTIERLALKFNIPADNEELKEKLYKYGLEILEERVDLIIAKLGLLKKEEEKKVIPKIKEDIPHGELTEENFDPLKKINDFSVEGFLGEIGADEIGKVILGTNKGETVEFEGFKVNKSDSLVNL